MYSLVLALHQSHTAEKVVALTSYLEYTPLPDEPGLDWANYRLGLVYQQLGDKQQARQYFQQALALNADHAEAKRLSRKSSVDSLLPTTID